MARIISPMATGNGAYIVHKELEKRILGYSVRGYHPYLTLMPLSLRTVDIKNADIIHTTPDYACFFMRSSTPFIITFHNYVLDLWMIPFSSLLQRIHYKTDLQMFTRCSVSKAHTITAVSRYTAEIAKKNLGISRSIKVIYNGIDTQTFLPVQSSRKRGNFRVLFSGNLSLRKGAQWLPAISERLNRNITIYYTSGLRGSKMISPSLNMVPVGSIPYNRMPEFYNTMDILLLPTVREGLSMAVFEAMSCGLPVVASDCSSLPEQVIDCKGGFLCPVGDVDAFANRINVLADSARLRKEMGAYNRARVEKHFTIDKMIDGYKQLFEAI
jgi:L-malate glycosyltransferase